MSRLFEKKPTKAQEIVQQVMEDAEEYHESITPTKRVAEPTPMQKQAVQEPKQEEETQTVTIEQVMVYLEALARELGKLEQKLREHKHDQSGKGFIPAQPL